MCHASSNMFKQAVGVDFGLLQLAQSVGWA